MTKRDHYQAGAASGARVEKGNGKWALVVTRVLHHPPDLVWKAITEAAHLKEWAPYDVDRDLDRAGPVNFTTVGTPNPQIDASEVTRAEPPSLLEARWGGNEMRWLLEPIEGGTRLTLWHAIDSKFIAMGAAGWQICFDVLEQLFEGAPLGRIVARDAMKHGWPRLHQEYTALFDAEIKGA